MRLILALLTLGLFAPELRSQDVPDKIAFLKFLEERTKTLDIYDQDGGWLDTKRVTEFDSLGLSFEYQSCEKTEWGDGAPIKKVEIQAIVLSPKGEGSYGSRIKADFDAIFYNEMSGETVSWPVVLSFKRVGDEFRIMSIHEKINGIHWSRVNGYWHRPSAFIAYRLTKKYQEYLSCHEDFTEFEEEPWGYELPDFGKVKRFYIQNADGSLKFIADTTHIRLAVKDETEGFDATVNYKIEDSKLIARFVYLENNREDQLVVHYLEDGDGLRISNIFNSNKELQWNKKNGMWSAEPVIASFLDPAEQSLEKAFQHFLDTAELKNTPEKAYQFEDWSQEVEIYDENGDIVDQNTIYRRAFPVPDVKPEFRNSRVYLPIRSHSELGTLELFTLVFMRSPQGFRIVEALDELGREAQLF